MHETLALNRTELRRA